MERFRSNLAIDEDGDILRKPKDPTRTLYKKGQKPPPGAGRKKGTPNRTSGLIKDAISGACEKLGMLAPIYYRRTDGTLSTRIIGWKPTGEGGAQGYMIWLGCNYPSAFAALIGRTIPLQLNANANINATVTEKYADADIAKMTLEEKLAAFRDAIGMTKALPVESTNTPRMIEGEVVERKESEDDAER